MFSTERTVTGSHLFGLFIIFSLSVFIFTFGAGKNAGGAEAIHYTIGYNVMGVQAEIEINGVPILSGERAMFQNFGTIPVNKWLKPDKNIVTVKLKALPKNSDETGKFEVFLAAANKDQMVSVGAAPKGADESPRVFEFKWESGISKEKLPLEKRFEFTPKAVPVLELWTKTEVLKLDPETEKGAKEFLKVISEAFVKKNVDKLATVIEFTMNDENRSMFEEPRSLSDIKEDVKETVKMWNSEKAKFQPIDIASVKMILVAENRVIWVTDKRGKPVLRAKSSKGGEFSNDVYIARIGGKWVLAR